MNTLAYIKLNRTTGKELDHAKRNAWVFVRAEEGESQADAIAEMKLISSVCEAGAKHIIKSYIPRILFVDCIVTTSICEIASNPQQAFSVVGELQNEGVDLFTMIDGEIFKISSAISVLRAFHSKQ